MAAVRKSWLRRGLWAAIAIVTLVVLALLAARLFLATGPGRAFVEARIEAMQPAGQSVDIAGLRGDLMDRFTIDRLTVADAAGDWLVAEDVEVHWAPMRLIGGALRVEEVAAVRVDMLRRPELQTTGSDEGSSGGLPVDDITLESFLITELSLAEPVIGRPTDFAAEASLELTDTTGAIEAQLRPRDPGDDALLADLRWGQDQPLIGELQATGPAGGVFASLLRLDADQAFAARLNASGSLEDWGGEGAVEIGGSPAAQFAMIGAGDVITLDGEIDLTLHPLSREQTGRLGDTAAVDVRWRRSDMGQAISVIAESDTLRVEAARATTGEDAAPIEVRAVTETVQRVLGSGLVDASRLEIDGNVQRAAGGWSFDGIAEASDVRVEGGSAEAISGPVSVALTDALIAAAARLEARGFAADGEIGAMAGAAPLADFEAGYDRAAGLVTLRRLTLRAPGTRLDAEGRFATDLSVLDLSGDIALARNSGAALPVAVDATWQADLTDGVPRLVAGGTLSDLPDLPDAIAGNVGSQVAFEGLLTRPAPDTYSIQRFSARSGEVRLSGSGQRTAAGELAAQLELSATEFSVSGAEISTPRLNLTAAGPRDALALDARLEAGALRAGGQTLSAVKLSGTSTWTGVALRGQAELTGTYEDAPLSARGDLDVSQAGWQVAALEAGWRDLSARADMSGGYDGLASLEGAVAISGDLPTGLPAQSVRMDANLSGEDVRLNADLTEITAGPIQGLDLALQAAGTRSDLAFTLSAADGVVELAGIDRPLSAQFVGRATDPLAGLSVLEATGEVDLGRFALNTTMPLRLETTEAGRALSLGVDGLGGTITGTAVRAGDGIRLDAALANIALPDLLNLAGRPALAGTLDASVQLDTTGETATGQLEGRLSDIASPERDDVNLTLALDGTLDGDRLTLELRDLDTGGFDLFGAAETRLDLRGGPLGLPALSDAPLLYRLTGEGEISPLSGLVLSPQILLTGAADINLTGRWPDEGGRPEGHARLSGGRFEHGLLGLVLEDLDFDTQLVADEIRLRGLSASGGDGGTLEGAGAYRFGRADNSLEIQADRLRVINRRDVTATASGALTLAEHPDGLALTGALRVDRGEIGLDALPDGGFTTLDVQFPEAGENGTAAPAPRASPLSLDIELSAPGRIFVSGQGLDAEFGISAQISGTAGQPELTGRASIVRGRFELAGKRFTFRDSTIELAGDPADARLDLLAVRNADALEAQLQIRGTPRRPVIALSSVPDLPEDEILSRVLFGRSPSQLTTLETAQLASALAQLAGGGGFDLIGGLEDALGLDTLDIAFDETGAAEITTGQYLADDVYVEVKTGATGLPRLIIEWQPRSNVEVEADLTSTEGQDLAIKWKRDFD